MSIADTSTMTPLERMRALLGREAIDRVPMALWRHFPLDDHCADRLATSTLAFQQRYRWDLIKVTPSSSFCVRDWGAEARWLGHADGKLGYTRRVIEHPQDWERLPLLSPAATHLAAQRRALRRIRQASPDVPVLQTIFSPLAQAKNLAGNDVLLRHLHDDPAAVCNGLQTIALSTRAYIASLLDENIDGIFYAIQHGQTSAGLYYGRFGLPFDLLALQPASALWCNMLHLHGGDVDLALFEQLNTPQRLFTLLNWHDREGGPSLRQAAASCDAVLCGGLSTQGFLADPAKLLDEARGALADAPRLVLGAGCVLPFASSEASIAALQQGIRAELRR